MSFFDTYGNNGDIVSQVLSDVLLIQSALSEKVGNYIHNMATFFSGLVIGLINCWQIALITLATGPFIVAAGGISNIFLHRPARISRLENKQELNLVQIKESKWLVKCFLNYLRHEKRSKCSL
jgi:ABC-type multidrug transport system fused ATPase/permease subunit